MPGSTGVVGLGTPASAASPTICGLLGTRSAAAVRAGRGPAERWRWTPGGRRHASSRRSCGAPRRANPLRTSRRLPRSRPLSAPAMAPFGRVRSGATAATATPTATAPCRARPHRSRPPTRPGRAGPHLTGNPRSHVAGPQPGPPCRRAVGSWQVVVAERAGALWGGGRGGCIEFRAPGTELSRSAMVLACRARLGMVPMGIPWGISRHSPWEDRAWLSLVRRPSPTRLRVPVRTVVTWSHWRHT